MRGWGTAISRTPSRFSPAILPPRTAQYRNVFSDHAESWKNGKYCQICEKCNHDIHSKTKTVYFFQREPMNLSVLVKKIDNYWKLYDHALRDQLIWTRLFYQFIYLWFFFWCVRTVKLMWSCCLSVCVCVCVCGNVRFLLLCFFEVFPCEQYESVKLKQSVVKEAFNTRRYAYRICHSIIILAKRNNASGNKTWDQTMRKMRKLISFISPVVINMSLWFFRY